MYYVVETGRFSQTELHYDKAIQLAKRILEAPGDFLLDGEKELQGRRTPDELVSPRYSTLDEMYADLDE